MTVQRMPQELNDLILEYLANDIPTLKTCSLVASAFTRTCQALLFHTLHLQSTAQLSQRVQSSPHIFKHVRRLKISELYSSRWIVSALQQDAFTKDILPHFANVHSVELAFTGISWELLAPAQATFRHALSTATFPRLRAVSIEGVYYVPTAARMLDLVGPTIERLRLQNVHLKRVCLVDSIVASTAEEPCVVPNITVLQVLSLGNLNMLVDLKRGDVILPNMHTLEVLVQSWAEVKVLPFITQNARNLVIHWDFSNPGFRFEERPSAPGIPALAFSPSLQCIELHIHRSKRQAVSVAAFSMGGLGGHIGGLMSAKLFAIGWWKEFLSAMGGTVAEIRIDMSTELTGWSELDSFLAEGGAPGVRRVSTTGSVDPASIFKESSRIGLLVV